MPLIWDRVDCAWILEEVPDETELNEVTEFPWSLPRRRSPPLSPSLCSFCSQIHFPGLFRKLLRGTELRWRDSQIFRHLSGGIRLGLWESVRLRADNCTFCGLIREYVNHPGHVGTSTMSALHRHSTEVRLYNAVYTSEGRSSHLNRLLPSERRIEISFHPVVAPESAPTALPLDPILSFTILDKTRTLGPEVQPRQKRGELNIYPLLGWLDACRSAQARQPTDSSKDVWPDIHKDLQLTSRVIDLVGKRIVAAPLNCQYVALSYVWGKTNFMLLNKVTADEMAAYGSIERLKLPATIRDAITLCKAMGERYLWVDSLCIVQDMEDKHKHMMMMEAIYRGAVVTLVAAGGSHADSGLPGFSASFGRTPIIRDVQGLRLATPGPNFKSSVDSSFWNTRTWTYQERILSNRLIIFTSDGVYFSCKHGNAEGDSTLDPHDATYLANGTYNSVDFDDYRVNLQERLNFSLYGRIVREYSGRHLTYHYDIENAFGGVRKIFSIIFGGSEVLFGMPLSALALCLLWHSDEPLTRRTMDGVEAKRLEPFPGASLTPDSPSPPQSLPPSLRSSSSRGSAFARPVRLLNLISSALMPPSPGVPTSTSTDSRAAVLSSHSSEIPNPSFRDPSTATSPLLPGTPKKQTSVNRAAIASSSHSNMLPSWSWVGWVGRVGYSNVQHAGERVIFKAAWLDPLNNFWLLPDEHFGPPGKDWEGRSRWLRQMSREGELYYTQRNGNPASWFSYPMEPFFHNPIPIDRETGSLHLRARLAKFKIKVEAEHNRRQLSLLDANGSWCGVVTMDQSREHSGLDAAVTVMEVSQTTLKEGEDDPAWSPETSSYSQAPGRHTARIGMRVASEGLPFDPAAYDPTVCWCLYNVLVVTPYQRRLVYRLGVGQVHIHAFDEAANPADHVELG